MRYLKLIVLLLTTNLFGVSSRYIKEKLNHPPSWMVKEIKSVRFKQKGKPTLPTRNDLKHHMHVKIQNGKIRTNCLMKSRNGPFRIKKAQEFLNRINRACQLPNAEFLICLEDDYRGRGESNLPILAYAKLKSEKECFLIPDYAAVTGYFPERTTIDKANRKIQWKNKKNKVFWRGSTTGGGYSKKNWKTHPRSLLVLLSLENPKLIDARFTRLCQGAQNIAEMKKLKGSFVKPEHSLHCKYLIDVDGNTCTFPRLYWILASNSLLIKHNSENVQWFYSAMTPYEHFVPCKRDLSNLKSVIEWAVNNDKKCEEIMKNGMRFAKNHLGLKHTMLYTYLLVRHIARLQKGWL